LLRLELGFFFLLGLQLGKTLLEPGFFLFGLHLGKMLSERQGCFLRG
jgi:hypothetical protein